MTFFSLFLCSSGGSGDDMDLDDEDYEAREAERSYTLNMKVLSAVLAFGTDSLETRTVNLEQFGKVLNWFGPIHDVTSSVPFLERVRHLVAKSWFHGDIQQKESERLLEGRPDGTFLIRYSNKIPGTFTITKKQDGCTSHQRVSHKIGSGYQIKMQANEMTFDSLEQLVEKAGSELNLITCCPGSKYAPVFLSTDPAATGYVFQ